MDLVVRDVDFFDHFDGGADRLRIVVSFESNRGFRCSTYLQKRKKKEVLVLLIHMKSESFFGVRAWPDSRSSPEEGASKATTCDLNTSAISLAITHSLTSLRIPDCGSGKAKWSEQKEDWRYESIHEVLLHSLRAL